MESNAYKKLLNNTLIFAIGNLGSKGITLLLVPLYTFHLTQTEYGLVDLFQVTITLLVPIVSLSIFEAVLRFVMDDEDVSAVFTNCLFITSISSLIILLLSTIFFSIGFMRDFLPYIAIIIILQLFYSLYTQFVRGLGMVGLFAISGLLMSLVVLIMNLLFIVWLELGVIGYLVSMILGLFTSLIYININVNSLKYINLSSISINLNKRLLKYSLPLMPNTLMWWIINASSRFFILLFAGTSYNGLFATASKIPSILSLFNTIFFKAWELSAIEEYDSKNKKNIYSNIFNYYQQFLFIVLASILLFLKTIFEFLIGKDFYDAWIYVPFLLIGVLFSSFSSFLGTNYIASKETKGVFKTSIIGGTTSLVLNIITIPLLGVIGASISSMISFMVMTIIRLYDTKKYIVIEYNYKKIFLNFGLIFLQVIILYLNLERSLEYTLNLIIFSFLLINNKEIIKGILSFTSKKIKK
ncbi:hypothetical protein CIL03_11335 [Virgibacillus indicus]|uniref:Uncharacterized protein n=1 Tax=Virgibacillus indicus TaxID=2024554 RepID=A0A265N883_9BACI|nr:polysaccharide biosynthesis C-terminal domain-containing protein [Virgibacillus indicus]OZU88240.1 hypothetical protein CIL03_11335 [Virgibacillus indicus]